MRKFSVASTAIAMGLMLSPESLVRLGNSMGASGVHFAVALVVAASLQMVISVRHGNALASFPPKIGEIEIMEKGLGRWPAVLLPVCSRAVTAVCLSTAVLATAGFVFNEVFLYWFPNFGFAFILLAFLVLINLSSPAAAKGLQICFVVLSLGGLVVLSLAQFAMSSFSFPVQQPGGNSPDWGILFSALFLFIGFDLAAYAAERKPHSSVPISASMVIGICIAASVLCVWGLASSAVVSWSKLRETTVPHMLAARQILGEEGRWIAGAVVLAGACASVNALIQAGSQMIAAMSEKGLLPRFLRSGRGRATVPVILLGAAIALMLAAGMAGDPRLDVYVRAGLLFWLLHYAGFHYSLLSAGMKPVGSCDVSPVSQAISKVSVFAFVSYVSAFLVLVWTDADRSVLLGFMSVVAGSSIVLYGAGRIVHRLRPKTIADRPCSDRSERTDSRESRVQCG